MACWSRQRCAVHSLGVLWLLDLGPSQQLSRSPWYHLRLRRLLPADSDRWCRLADMGTAVHHQTSYGHWNGVKRLDCAHLRRGELTSNDSWRLGDELADVDGFRYLFGFLRQFGCLPSWSHCLASSDRFRVHSCCPPVHRHLLLPWYVYCAVSHMFILCWLTRSPQNHLAGLSRRAAFGRRTIRFCVSACTPSKLLAISITSTRRL
jgi:hypothetical protein